MVEPITQRKFAGKSLNERSAQIVASYKRKARMFKSKDQSSSRQSSDHNSSKTSIPNSTPGDNSGSLNLNNVIDDASILQSIESVEELYYSQTN